MGSRVRMILVAIFLILIINGLVSGEVDRDKGRLPEKYGKVKTIQLIVEQSYEQAPTVKLPIEIVTRRILEASGFKVVNATAENYDANLTVTVTGEAFIEKYIGGPQYSGARIKGEVTLGLGTAVWWTDSFEGMIPPPEFIFRLFGRPSDAPFMKAYEISGHPLTIYAVTYALGVERSLSPITDALRDRQANVRCKALNELGRFQVPQALSSVRGMLNDSEPVVKIGVLQILGQYKDEKAVNVIMDMLGDKNVDVRRQAARTLGEIGDYRAVKSLVNAIKTDSLIRMSAANALERIGEPSVEPLINLLKEKNLDGLTKEAIIETLGDLKDPRASAPLIDELRTTDSWGRKKTINALVKIGIDATNSLFNALKDPEPQVREGVIEVLGLLKAPQSLGPLVERLQDPVPEVRVRAAWALGELEDEQALTALAEIADRDPDTSVRNAAHAAADRIRFH